jgi:hypothetical protein
VLTLTLVFTLHPLPFTAVSAELPSLFRGVVLADSEAGVRVVSVEESSQAYLADLRPEDIVVRVRDADVRTIDEFAALSSSLKGTTASATLLVFRNGAPRELTLHLYSYPVLRAWNVEFLPDHDVRFAQPSTGFEYWVKLGEGFERAGRPADALNAYLNGLHNLPDDVPTALRASQMLVHVSQEQLRQEKLAEGLAELDRALRMMNRIFARPLDATQLASIKRQLTQALAALRQAKPLAEGGPISGGIVDQRH